MNVSNEIHVGLILMVVVCQQLLSQQSRALQRHKTIHSQQNNSFVNVSLKNLTNCTLIEAVQKTWSLSRYTVLYLRSFFLFLNITSIKIVKKTAFFQRIHSKTIPRKYVHQTKLITNKTHHNQP